MSRERESEKRNKQRNVLRWWWSEARGCTAGEESDRLCWFRAGSVQSGATDGCQESNKNHTHSLRAGARTHTHTHKQIYAERERKQTSRGSWISNGVCIQRARTFAERELGFVPALRRGASGVCLEGLTASRWVGPGGGRAAIARSARSFFSGSSDKDPSHRLKNSTPTTTMPPVCSSPSFSHATGLN